LANIASIYTNFRNRMKANCLGLFRSDWKYILYLQTIYVCCVYPTMSKSQKQLAYCLKRAAAFLSFSAKSVFILLLFLTVALHESAQENYVFCQWAYDTKLST